MLDGQILNKPADAGEARDMLRSLRGRGHQVLTGITVLDGDRRQTITDCASTEVFMRDYGDSEIDDYIASGDPFDKAGAYAIQNAVFRPVARLAGCYTNVVGLPMCHVVRALRRFGIEPSVNVPDGYRTFGGVTCWACERVLAQPPPQPASVSLQPSA